MTGIHWRRPDEPENVADPIAFDLHFVAGEVTCLGVVKGVAADSLEDHPLPRLGQEHDRLMLAPCPATGGLTLDLAGELFE
jgi:hypothetical protein